MRLGKDAIKAMLDAVFPALIDWLPCSESFLAVTPQDMQALINAVKDPANRYIPGIWDCSEIAMAALVDIRRRRKDTLDTIPVSMRINQAIGEALGTRFKGIDKPHHCNIFIAIDGVYLFDMQTGAIWPAKRGQDQIFFMRM